MTKYLLTYIIFLFQLSVNAQFRVTEDKNFQKNIVKNRIKSVTIGIITFYGPGFEIYDFDTLGRIIKVTNLNDTTQFAYDKHGFKKIVGTNGIRTYNHLGQLIREQFYNNEKDSTNNITFIYDKKGRQIRVVSFMKSLEQKIRVEKAYDKNGNLVSEVSFQNDEQIYKFSFKYNDKRQLTTVTRFQFVPKDITVETYEYGSNGLPNFVDVTERDEKIRFTFYYKK